MSAEQIAFQVVYAAVESTDGADPTASTESLLREQRVLAALRPFAGDELVVLLPVTDTGSVVALAADGKLHFGLDSARLVELFAEQGLTLHLGIGDDALEEVDAELEQEYGDAFEQLDDPARSPEELSGFGMTADADEFTDDLFEPEPVRVAEFSRRGPWAARVTAQLLNTTVDYLQTGTWSLYAYRTDRAHAAISGGRADLPIIEVNIPASGELWVEVTAPHGRSGMFWPNAERLTKPVLDIDEIAVPASADVYRRMLAEADGAREELVELGLGDGVDLETAMRACLPEALGGIAGEDARLRAFILAFGVPASLITAGLDDRSVGRRFAPRGWMRVIGGVLLGGLAETTPLTRTDRPLHRISAFLHARPLLGASVSLTELAAGVALGRSRSGLGRGLGVLLVIDALADFALWAVRLRRR